MKGKAYSTEDSKRKKDEKEDVSQQRATTVGKSRCTSGKELIKKEDQGRVAYPGDKETSEREERAFLSSKEEKKEPKNSCNRQERKEKNSQKKGGDQKRHCRPENQSPTWLKSENRGESESRGDG